MPKETTTSSDNATKLEVIWNAERDLHIGVGTNVADWNDPAESWWITIDDRADLNRLIRQLRRARDQVWGEDA